MMDMFPYPSVTEGKSEKHQIMELLNYLIQFKETLEFALGNISEENLSPLLAEKLNALGLDIKKSNEERADEVSQISSKTLTVSDVCNSNLFKLAVQQEVSKYL